MRLLSFTLALGLLPPFFALAVAPLDVRAQPVSPMPPLPPGAVLRKLVDDTRLAYNKLERPMVVFDLDGALFDRRPRTAAVLREYAQQELRTVRPEAAQKLANLSPSSIGYMLTDTLSITGITEAAVLNNASVYWSQHFFTDEYIKHDVPVPGSVELTRTLYSNGARIVYVSARDVPRQLIGTVKALRDRGFPIGIAGTELVLKPSQDMPDAQFKQQVITYLRHYGKVMATFDTQPMDANDYRRIFPDALVVLVNGPRAPNQPNVAAGVTFLAEYQY